MDLSSNSTTNIISICSLSVSAIVFFFYIKDRKRNKFQMISEYRNELLCWHGDTVELLIFLKALIKNKDKEGYSNALSRLSSQIEKGRFYFPNIRKGDNFGHDKPEAYKGYRNLTLDFLVYSHNILSKSDAEDYIKHLNTLHREFTSIVFEITRPNDHLKAIKKVTDTYFNKDVIFEDFLKRDPDSIHFLLKK